MPNFLNTLRKLPGLLDPERLMKTPPFAGDAPKPVATPAMQPIAAPPKPVAMPAPIRPSINAPMSLPTPDLTPAPEPVAQHPGFDRMKDFYRRGDALIDRRAIQGLEDQYIQERGQKRGIKDILLNAFSGAAQGMATTGDLGGALGGALAGGAGTAISPRAGARFGFNTRERPELEGLYGQQQQDKMLALKEGLQRAQILTQQTMQARNQAQADRAGRPEAPKLQGFGMGEDVFSVGPNGAQLVRPGQQKPESIDTVNFGGKLYNRKDMSVLATDPGYGLKVEGERQSILGQMGRDQRDREEHPLRIQKLQGEINAPTGSREASGMSPQQQANYIGKMRDAIAKFEELKQGVRANDPALQQAAQDLQSQFGEDIEVLPGDQGYPYAKPRVVQTGDGRTLTISDIRKMMRKDGATDAEINDEFRKRGYIK